MGCVLFILLQLMRGMLMNTFIRQRVTADKYNIQLVIHTRQHTQFIHIRQTVDRII